MTNSRFANPAAFTTGPSTYTSTANATTTASATSANANANATTANCTCGSCASTAAAIASTSKTRDNANANAYANVSDSRGAATVRFATIGTPASSGAGRADGPAKPNSRTGSVRHYNCRLCNCWRTAKSAHGATAARRRRFSRPEQPSKAHQHRCTAPDSRASDHSNYPAPCCCFGCSAANTCT